MSGEGSRFQSIDDALFAAGQIDQVTRVDAGASFLACGAYSDALRRRPHDPTLRQPICRPPAPIGCLSEPKDDAPDEEWKLYRKCRESIERAWVLYWQDLAERVDVLFAERRRLRGLPSDLTMIETRIDDALKLGARGALPMFALHWPRGRADIRHAKDRHAELFALVDAELKRQGAFSNVSRACNAVHSALLKSAHPQHRLLSFGAQGRQISPTSLREMYAKRGRWTSQRQARAVDIGARMAIRADLMRAAKVHLPRLSPQDPERAL